MSVLDKVAQVFLAITGIGAMGLLICLGLLLLRKMP